MVGGQKRALFDCLTFQIGGGRDSGAEETAGWTRPSTHGRGRGGGRGAGVGRGRGGGGVDGDSGGRGLRFRGRPRMISERHSG